MTRPVVVVAAGGTGGHVFPGIAVADALTSRADVDIVFVGTTKGFEGKVVPANGYAVEMFGVSAIKGGGARRAVRGSLSVVSSMAHAVRFLRQRSPRIVVTIGGYAAGPVALAALGLGIPVAIVEPNSVMGFSNRLIAPFARRIYLAFKEAAPVWSRAETSIVGVPLRGGFVVRPAPEKGAPDNRILILGGSQGAEVLNERMPEALADLKRDVPNLEVRHQSGEGSQMRVREAYARTGIEARVVAFSSLLEEDLAWSDVVVARAGAGTIAEIAAVGRPSVLIPYPHAVDDHQAKNAAAFAATGAAVWVRQASADSTRIAMEIRRILTEPGRRQEMTAHAVSFGRPQAAARIAEDLCSFAHINPRVVMKKPSATVSSPVIAKAS